MASLDSLRERQRQVAGLYRQHRTAVDVLQREALDTLLVRLADELDLEPDSLQRANTFLADPGEPSAGLDLV
jgi:hypothetical protein